MPISLAQVLAVLSVIAPELAKVLLSVEQNNLAPMLYKVVDEIQSPDLKELVSGLAKAVDAFAQAEIQKLAGQL